MPDQQASGTTDTWTDAQHGARQGARWAGARVATAALAATLRDGWRAGAAALWAAGRRREAAWLRAEYRAAAALVEALDGARPHAVRDARRRCRAMARVSARHVLLAAPWREAARVLGVLAAAAPADGPTVARRPVRLR